MVTDPATPDFNFRIHDLVGTLSIPRVFTVNEAIAFKEAFNHACRNYASDLTRIELDFQQTSFIDSSGIGALINTLKLSQQHHIEMVLINVATPVMMALSMTDLDKVFTIQTLPEIQEALTTRPSKEQKPYATHPSVKSRMKRFIDIVGAIVGLGITGLLFAPIAIAIYLDDPGPIFFEQTRCSWMGRRFKMWKFRSMVSNAEKLKHTVQNQVSGPIFKNENDPRITRVGRFLRKTSLDELPQFWNVLKGDMSLVGTRPPTPDEIDKYEIPQWQRLDVKPGMTGEWQVNGRSSVKSFEDVIRLDLKYQENWSLRYDLQLIVKTILVLFNKKSGAM
jgi:anti-anti-sigma factor